MELSDPIIYVVFLIFLVDRGWAQIKQLCAASAAFKGGNGIEQRSRERPHYRAGMSQNSLSASVALCSSELFCKPEALLVPLVLSGESSSPVCHLSTGLAACIF